MQFRIQKFLPRLRVCITRIELERFLGVGQRGFKITLVLVNERTDLIILRFLRAKLDRLVVIAQRLVVILQLHLGISTPLIDIGGV